MILCHCEVVTDGEVRDAIATGASSLCAIAERCSVGRRCGGCLPAVRTHLADHGLPTDEHLTPRELRGLADRGTPTGDDAVAV